MPKTINAVNTPKQYPLTVYALVGVVVVRVPAGRALRLQCLPASPAALVAIAALPHLEVALLCQWHDTVLEGDSIEGIGRQVTYVIRLDPPKIHGTMAEKSSRQSMK